MSGRAAPGATARDDAGRRALAGAAFALGFALSGFFDGILLHQILQWHHLLSALEGDLRFQVVADGWFHAAMYGVAALGLWRLWRARGALDAPGAGRALAAWGLIGFGAWHVVDAVGSHWLLGLHRIRMDAEAPLAWDLGWLAAFGLLPLALGLVLRRRGGPGRPGATAAALALFAVGAGVWAAVPPPGRPLVAVAFAPRVPGPAAFAAAARASDGGVVWADEAAGVFVLAGLRPRAAARLYRHGALFVGGAGLPGGCLARSDAG